MLPADRFARLGRAADHAFGEKAVIQARTTGRDVNARPGPDAGRSDQVDVVGIFALEQRVPMPPVKKVYDPSIREIAANKGTFDCEESALAWLPRVNDLIVRTATGSIFSIANVARDGAGRVTFLLSASS